MDAINRITPKWDHTENTSLQIKIDSSISVQLVGNSEVTIIKKSNKEFSPLLEVV